MPQAGCESCWNSWPLDMKTAKQHNFKPTNLGKGTVFP